MDGLELLKHEGGEQALKGLTEWQKSAINSMVYRLQNERSASIERQARLDELERILTPVGGFRRFSFDAIRERIAALSQSEPKQEARHD